MPLWFITPDLNVAVLAWHTVHACAVGMWFTGLATPELNDVVDVWQVAQSPVTGWLGFCAGVGRVTVATPNQALPAS